MSRDTYICNFRHSAMGLKYEANMSARWIQ